MRANLLYNVRLCQTEIAKKGESLKHCKSLQRQMTWIKKEKSVNERGKEIDII